MCRLTCKDLGQKRLLARALLVLCGAKVRREGMPDVTYYVWANARPSTVGHGPIRSWKVNGFKILKLVRKLHVLRKV